MIELAAGDYRLVAAPEQGGAILRFDWRGEPLLRPVCGPSILDVACFPLVPFSNRIARGQFHFAGRDVRLAPNFPGSAHPHPLHGFGWLAPWTVAASNARSAELRHVHAGGEWPWSYSAAQTLALDDGGLTLTLSATNTSAERMPVGLGFHPYFPRESDTRYLGLHRGEWRNDPDCLPLELDMRDEPIDWWAGTPVASRSVDTAYVGRSGSLAIVWPARNTMLTLECSHALCDTVVYTPAGQDFFCVEPVTHTTDAFNRSEGHVLEPGATLHVAVSLTAERLDRGTP